MHAGNGTHRGLDRRAVECFDAALTDVGLTEQPLRGVLHRYFTWATERMGMHPDSPDSVADDERPAARALGRARHPLTRAGAPVLTSPHLTGRRCRSPRPRVALRSPSP